MKRQMTPISPESLEYLTQIAESISILSGKSNLERSHADRLYQEGLAMMLAVAPSPFQKEWNKIQIARVRIGSEHIQQTIAQRDTRNESEEELTREEEALYQTMLSEDPAAPFRS